MERLRRAAVITAAVVVLAGCTPAQQGPAVEAATEFEQHLSTQDWSGACDLLSEEARTRLEAASARTCTQALPVLGLTVGRVGAAEVWGRNASVRVGDGAVFLSRFEDGWRVIGAGCVSRGEDRPYDCTVRG